MELPIQVAARTRNLDDNGNENANSFVCTVTPTQRQLDSFMTGGLVEIGQQSFPVTHALPINCTQSQVYYQTVFPLINLFLEGFDTSVVSYGQKGMGKTYTLYGPLGQDCTDNEAEQGIVHRCVREIFAHIANNSDRTYGVSIGWVEICEDTINDLLGIGNVHCKNVPEVFHWLQIGFEAKALQNFGTEASVHTLFTITLEQQWVSKEGLIQHRLSTASFSDLAPTERILVVNPLDQTANILKDPGLRALEQIVCTLTDPTLMYSVNGNIPYNQTALTTLLKDSFGGRAQTLVILCISPLERDSIETIANLQFAFKIQCVRNFVIMNTFSDNNTPIQQIGTSELANGGLSPAVVENFGLQFAASQWLKLVSNAEGLFSKLISNNGISEFDKEQIEEWLFLKQECEECLSSNEVLRSQKQLRPIQETDEPEETLSEPDVSCQPNSDNESDLESQRPDLAEKLEMLMDELQLKTDGLIKDKYNEFMERQPKPVMESQESLCEPKKEISVKHDDNNDNQDNNDERKTSVGGRRRSIQPGASLSSVELVMLNRVASREQAGTVVPKAGTDHADFISMGSLAIQPCTVLPLRAAQNSPMETIQKKLRKIESDIEARMRQIKEVEETIQLKQNIITDLVKNSETRSNAKQRFHKKKSKLEAEYEKAKKQLDKAIIQSKEKAEIERLRNLLEHLNQRLQDLISIKHIAGDSAQKVKKLQQSLHESKKLMEDLQKKVKKERKVRDQLASELKSLKEKENGGGNTEKLDDTIYAPGTDIKQLKEVQARISHLDHVLREKSENLAEFSGNRGEMNAIADNSNEEREGLRHEIRNLRRTRDHLLEQRCALDRKLKREKILSYREERKLLECDEAIEAIDAAIEFKNELICGHKSIDTSERLQREKGEQMLMARLNKLSAEEMRTLLYKYFTKVIDLRDSSRKLEVQLMQLERERDAWEWKERALSNAVRQARLEGERNAVLLQRQHEMKLTLMLRHLADETSLSSSGFSDQLRPTVHRYLNPVNMSLTPSGTDSDFDFEIYKNSLHAKMLKPAKHGEIEICPTLPDALTKYKPLDKLKDKERESKNKLLAKFQVLTRYAGQSMMPTSVQYNVDDSETVCRSDNENGNGNGNGNGVLVSTIGVGAIAQTVGNNRKKKDKSHKETHAVAAAAAAAVIPQENLKRLISTQPTTKVTRQKNKIIIQDASRKN